MSTPTGSQGRVQSAKTRRHRRDPVSCAFCREKKLRCDRLTPCSNCYYRDLSCSNQAPSHSQREPASEKAAVLDRLKQLEGTVLKQQQLLDAYQHNSTRSHALSATTLSGAEHALTGSYTADDQNDGPRRHQTDRSYATPISDYAETFRTLEDTGLHQDSCLTANNHSSSTRIVNTRHIALVSSDPALRDLVKSQPTISCMLPSEEEALLLLDYYRNHLHEFRNFLHMPTLLKHVTKCYGDLRNEQPVPLSILVLILSVLASSSAIMSHNEIWDGMPFSQMDSTRVSTYWATCALNLLNDMHRKPCDTIEDVQATVLLAFHSVHAEGFSAKLHYLFSVAISRAHDLLVHKIDAVSPTNPTNAIETEIKRRVWWYLVTADWILALSGGPQEGTYSVQPHHMVVNLIRNVDDEDLASTDQIRDRPRSEPTSMSYYIQRIRLAELCREAADMIPMSHHVSASINYRAVVALDKRFEAFLAGLPVFLRNDEESIRQSVETIATRPYMRTQRQALFMTTNAKRCKLHQPFLIRGFMQGSYSYSRNASLKSARAVLEESRLVEANTRGIPPCESHAFRPYFIYYTFMATIVLVMELCFTRKSALVGSQIHDGAELDDEETLVTKAEVMAACRSLRQDHSTTGIGAMYLASLMDVLRRFKVKLRSEPVRFVDSGQAAEPRNNHTATARRSQSKTLAGPSYGFETPSDSSQQFLSLPIPPGPIPELTTTSYTNPNTIGGAASSSQLMDNAGFMDMANVQPRSLNQPVTPSSIPSAGFKTSLADFDDIWNDYVELGPNLNGLQWDNLFSSLEMDIT